MDNFPTIDGTESGSQSAPVWCYMHDLFATHDPGPMHPENPGRATAVAAAVRRAAGVRVVAAPAARVEALERVHDPGYLEWVRGVCESGGGRLDADTVVGPRSFDAALRACGGTIAGVDAVLAGDAGAAFVAGRPPGHHAERALAMGFCIVNQAAVGAAHARAGGVERVAILDWDVHHGNGTQAIFWDDPAVLYVSLHQFGWGFYPGTGVAAERGGDAAVGATLNLPLAVGTQQAEYLEAFRSAALPALADHRPQLVLVSSGFDAHRADPLGSLGLGEDAFATMTREVAGVGAPQVHVLEGGYDLRALEVSVAAVLEALVDAAS
jgi:acetoin utilization deacetylase AcuC-like enzyme